MSKIVLLLVGLGVGYMLGEQHKISDHDKAFEAWKQRSVQWQKDYAEWKIQDSQENK